VLKTVKTRKKTLHQRLTPSTVRVIMHQFGSWPILVGFLKYKFKPH